MAIQINGKVRASLDIPVDASDDRIKELTLSDEKTKAWLGANPVKKIIIVPNKLINIVV
jgi:leucyl-tRNA synthetase